MKEKSVQDLISAGLAVEGEHSMPTTVYEENSDIKLFYIYDQNWYENLNHDKYVLKENFHKLYLAPLIVTEEKQIEKEHEGDEPILQLKQSQFTNEAFRKYCQWKGLNYSIEKNNAENKKIELTLSMAKEFGLV